MSLPLWFPPADSSTLDMNSVIAALSGGTAYYPLDDAAAASNARVLNPAAALGRNLALNGGFATNTIWTKGSGWTIAGGVAVATAAAAGANLSQSLTNYMIVGRTYRVTYDVVVTSGTIAAKCGSSGFGTTRSASGTYTEDIVCGTTNSFMFAPITTFTGTIDNVSVQCVNPTSLNDTVNLPGAVSGATSGLSGRFGNYYNFDKTNDSINLFSASFNDILPVSVGSLIIAGRITDSAVWSDATARRLVTLQADTSNRVYLEKRTTSNSVGLHYQAGGTDTVVNVTSFSPSDWFLLGLTWDKAGDAVKAYVNGAQSGATQTGLGTWAGNLTTTTAAIGASSSAGAAPWGGDLGQLSMFNRVLTAAEMLSVAQAGGFA